VKFYRGCFVQINSWAKIELPLLHEKKILFQISCVLILSSQRKGYSSLEKDLVPYNSLSHSSPNNSKANFITIPCLLLSEKSSWALCPS
jgi:hypothetical protein